MKYYGPRLIVVSLIWFIYDFSAYSFGIYSSDILDSLLKSSGATEKLWVSFGWSTLLNFFYMPGCIGGSFLSDSRLGAKKTLIIALVLQAIVGFGMAAGYNTLSKHIGGFVVVYGLFLALGEVGPGDNIGLFAAKTSSTHMRGKYYGLAAAIGKIGAFSGSYAFPAIGKRAGDNTVLAGQYQFYTGASLAIFAACLGLLLPELDQDVVANEDIKFRQYLEENGYDTSVLGIKSESAEVLTEEAKHDEKVGKLDESVRY